MTAVAAYLRYDHTGASTKYRILQYLPFLQAHRVYVEPVFGPPPRPTMRHTAIATSRKLFSAASEGHRQATGPIIIQKESCLPPPLGHAVLRLLRQAATRRGVPLIWDVDDAVWTLSESRRRLAEAQAREADLVVAGNQYLADWSESIGTPSIILPTCAPTLSSPLDKSHQSIRLLWLGSPATQRYLRQIAEQLAIFLKETPDAHLDVIGAALPEQLQGLENALSLPWTPDNERRALRTAHAGLSPQPRGSWEDGKCGFKVIQYLAHGLIPIVSDVPQHRQILDELGIRVPSQGEWLDALRSFSAQGDSRAAHAAACLGRAQAHFDISVGATRWAQLLRFPEITPCEMS